MAKQSKAKPVPVLHRVCVMVTDLQREHDGGWSANCCWVRRYFATHHNSKQAERLAIGIANAAHGRFRPDGWADNSGSWRIPGTAVGACVEWSGMVTDYAFPCMHCGAPFTVDGSGAMSIPKHCDSDSVDGFAPDHMADHEPQADPVHRDAIAKACGEAIANDATMAPDVRARLAGVAGLLAE